MTTYLRAGIGNNFYRQLSQNGTEASKGKQLIIPIETGLHFSYDLMTYLKLKTGFGCRFVAPNNSRELRGYYVKFGLSFNLNKFKETKEGNKTTTC